MREHENTVYVAIDALPDGRIEAVTLTSERPPALWGYELPDNRTIWQAELPDADVDSEAHRVLDLALSSHYADDDPEQWKHGEQLAEGFYSWTSAELATLRRIEAWLLLAGQAHAYTGAVGCQRYGITVRTPGGDHYLVKEPRGWVHYLEDPMGEDWIEGAIVAASDDGSVTEQDIAWAFNVSIENEVPTLAPDIDQDHHHSIAGYVRAAATLLGEGWTAESGYWGVTGTLTAPDGTTVATVGVDHEGDLYVEPSAGERIYPELLRDVSRELHETATVIADIVRSLL